MSLRHATRIARLFILALAIAATGICSPNARANSLSTDQSDLWWNPSESGWGMQLTHRGQVIFATIYNYDSTGKPTWGTAILKPAAAGWSGSLSVTTGPWFGAPTFDPATVSVRTAGTMTWSSGDGINGTVGYSVDGVHVSKNVVRQSLDNDDYSGRYSGALSWNNSCTGVHENFVEVVVTQLAQNVSINWVNQATQDNCSFSGTLNPSGQFGSIQGKFECGPVHDDGSFTFYEMSVTPFSLTGRYQSNDLDSGCSSSGYLGLARHR